MALLAVLFAVLAFLGFAVGSTGVSGGSTETAPLQTAGPPPTSAHTFTATTSTGR